MSIRAFFELENIVENLSAVVLYLFLSGVIAGLALNGNAEKCGGKVTSSEMTAMAKESLLWPLYVGTVMAMHDEIQTKTECKKPNPSTPYRRVENE